MRANHYMRTLFLFVFSIAFTGNLLGQHYYKDIVLTRELAEKRALFEANKVKTVRMKSFDNMNQPIEKFSCTQTVTNNFTLIKTVTTDPLTGSSESNNFFDANGRLVRSIDTTEGARNITTYAYNEAGQLTEVNSQSISPGDFKMTEQHLWSYDAKGRPQEMLKIKNGTDTTHVEFVLDDNGNVVEEKSRIKGVLQPGVYYYYDSSNRLTDVVRYNVRAQRMLPDYMFEYNDRGQLQTMLTPMQTIGDYQKWYYTYDEKGLKVKDECFNKARALIGRIEYTYQF